MQALSQLGAIEDLVSNLPCRLSVDQAQLALGVLRRIDDAIFSGDSGEWAKIAAAAQLLHAEPTTEQRRASVVSHIEGWLFRPNLDAPSDRVLEHQQENRCPLLIGLLANIDPAFGDLTIESVYPLFEKRSTRGGAGKAGASSIAAHLAIECDAFGDGGRLRRGQTRAKRLALVKGRFESAVKKTR